MAKKTTLSLKSMKENGEKITMITAYDYSSATLAQKAGIDTILVGDSLQMVMLGDSSTIAATTDVMIHHTKAVIAGAPDTFVVTDMPFGSCSSAATAIEHATRIMKEGRCDAVKIEGGVSMAPIIRAVVDAGIPVVGHIGLTPQTTSKLGGFKVQGKGEAAGEVLADALAVQEAGAFMIVLECVPAELSALISQRGLMFLPSVSAQAAGRTDRCWYITICWVCLTNSFRNLSRYIKRSAARSLQASANISLKSSRERFRKKRMLSAA